MQVSELLLEIKLKKRIGDLSTEINKIEFDSRKIENGDVFVAVRGTVVDGHDFIEKAVNFGAKVVVCEEIPKQIHDEIVYLQVEDSSKALSLLAANFYGRPTEELEIIAVTGTNGKTSVTSILYQMFLKMGEKAALLSTIQIELNGEIFPTSHTTPNPLELHKYFKMMVDRGIHYCFMEVSSHSLIQNRVFGINFRGAIFTNITHDHLDYHKTFLNYINAKKILFDNLAKDAFALVNLDDRNGEIMTQSSDAKVYGFALKTPTDFEAKVIDNSKEGLHLYINKEEVWLQLKAYFNAYNTLAAYATAVLLGFEKSEILLALSSIKSINGRFDSFVSETGITAVVDYAHTPDALENVLQTAKEITEEKDRVIVVVGCGGNRDKEKRPKMGKISAELGNLVIFTSDNPRDEEPEQIIEEMIAGVNLKDVKKCMQITNRKEAIEAAVHMAKSGDTLLVAGKGHETYQEIKGIRYDFDDKVVLKEAFEKFDV